MRDKSIFIKVQLIKLSFSLTDELEFLLWKHFTVID